MTATLMNPTDLRGVRDAVLDSAGSPRGGRRRHRRGLGGHPRPRRRGARPARADRGDHAQPGRHDGVGPRGHAAARAERRARRPRAARGAGRGPGRGRRDGRRPAVHRRRRAGRAGARLAARPGDRRDAGAGRRDRGPHRRPCDQERRGVRPRQARARRLRDARGDRRGGAAAAPAAPRRRRRWCCRARFEEAAEHAARILGGPYEPAALEWVSDPGRARVGAEAR